MIRFDDLSDGGAIAGDVGIRHWDVSIARVERGKLLGGVIYSDATEDSISIHTAGFSPNWLSRDLLWVVFHWPFVQCNFQATFVKVRSSNNKSIEFARRLGFNTVAELSEVYRSDVLIIMRMLKRDCRWLDLDCSARRIMTAARAA